MASLAGLGADYHADATDDGFDELPDGTYQATVDDVVLNHSKTSSRLQLSIETTVISGEHQNRKIFLHLGLDSKENVGKTKGQLLKLGFAFPEDPEELPDATQSLIGKVAEVLLKTSKQTGGQWRTITGEVDSDELPSGGGAHFLPCGSRVWVDEYGDEELGMITESEGDAITVEFDDGTVGTYTGDEVHVVDGKEEAEEVEEVEETEEAEDAEVTIEFEEDSLTDQQVEAITALAEENDFDADQYGTWSELLADMAEDAGVSGSFKKAKALIKAVKEASEE
jgi:uncharacterized surface protein with fasciclin (FAS1) repeats